MNFAQGLRNCLIGFCVILWLAAPALAAVNDLLPTDYVTLPGGYTTIAAYGFLRDQGGPYVRGERASHMKLDTQIAAMRISHFVEGMSMPVALTAIIPAARVTVDDPVPAGFNEQASGLADPRFSLTVWPISEPDKNHYLGLTAMVLAPLGEYQKKDAINIGENRWQAVMLLGWTKALGEHWIIDVSPEIALYGDNHRYLGNNKLSQDVSYALTGYLRYRINTNNQLMLGAQWNEGGSMEVNGADLHNAARNRRLYLGWMYGGLTPNTQLMARYGRDVEIENGFRFDNEFMLRLLWWFK